ncbi:HET-domain-containing protein [Plenodomus tracheiphilus IPT5]|uniref:HET-domain-containing protein n=1 Tax=Plenodomus tracheiphilus IPT5 TaxID=1408161 RepID=A0A6A7AVH4_9PLEO|nr:HET-domain-containing protein [Plenodomus tracheiphilus IPT5]
MADTVALDHYQDSPSSTSHSAHYQLCSRCVGLDLNALWSSTGIKLSLGTKAEWNIDSCAFCNFLQGILSSELVTCNEVPCVQSSGPDVDLEAGRAPSYYIYSMRTRKLPERLLQILEHRMIVVSNKDHGPPPKGVPFIAANLSNARPSAWLKPISPQIDFTQPKQWLRNCNLLHGDHCRGGRHNSVSNLRLIDCKSGDVIEALGDENYITLSYVWGPEADSRSQVSTYPQTIQDAVTVTKQLGYTWLWVDQYCMDQNNQTEFQDQLQQMDAIYRQSVVTLIAAAGSHADHGLPGVSKRLRRPSLSVTHPHGHLSAIRGVPDLSLRGCKWASRAWTYQEGLLSTRRLVFTDDQLYFECQGLYCTEMLDIPYETWQEKHHTNQPYLHYLYRMDPHMGIFPLDRCGVDPWDIFNRITEYSQRSLTFEADVLKGMLGIFRAFEREKSPIRHLYGVPFPQMALTSPNSTTAEGNAKRRLPTFSESLRWTLSAPSKRRDGFPSWSWTGWFGKVLWPDVYTASTYPHRTPRRLEHPRDAKVNEESIRLTVELRNGDLLDWNTFQKRYQNYLISGEFNGIILLEAYTTPATYLTDNAPTDIVMHLCHEDGQSTPVIVEKTTMHDLQPQDRFLAIHFHRTATRYQGRDTQGAANTKPAIERQHVLIIQDVGRCWERVAIGAFIIDTQVNVVREWRTLRLG